MYIPDIFSEFLHQFDVYICLQQRCTYLFQHRVQYLKQKDFSHDRTINQSDILDLWLVETQSWSDLFCVEFYLKQHRSDWKILRSTCGNCSLTYFLSKFKGIKFSVFLTSSFMTVAELRDLRAVVIFLPKSAKTILLVCVHSLPMQIYQYCLNFSRF